MFRLLTGVFLLPLLLMAFGTLSTNNVTATSLVVTAPSGIADTDILFALSTSDSATSTPGFPTGFVQPSGSPQTLSAFDANTFAVALKIASGESGNYTLTSTGSSIIGGVGRLTGRSQSTTPHRIVASKSDSGVANHSLTSSAFAAGVTTAICDVIVIAINDGAAANETFTQPAGYTKDADINDAGTNAWQFMVAHLDGVAAGFDGQLTVSSTGTTALAMFVIALAAAAAGSTYQPRDLAHTMLHQTMVAQ